MQYKLAVFDLDGTILDTLEDLTDAVNYSLEKHGMPGRSIEEIRCFVGNGIRRLIELSVPDGTDSAVFDSVFSCFRSYYSEHSADKTRPYPGIPEVLEELRRRKILTAVYSNKADAVVQDLCVSYFPGLFDVCIGEKEGLRRKPFPDGMQAIEKIFAVSKEEVLYIGDSEVDAETAENSGVSLLLADWGFRSLDFLLSLNAGKVLHCPEEILSELE